MEGALTGSLINNVLPDAGYFTIGEGATICHWTDRMACTVIDVSKSGATITLQADIVRRTDQNGMSDAQSYAYEPNPEGRTFKARRTRNGKGFRVIGSRERVVPGRDHHFDVSF
jgi:hypothetical protein